MNRRRFLFSCTKAGQSVEELLLEKGFSRRLIIRVKLLPDGLCINGEKVYITHRLTEDEVLTVTLPEETADSSVVPVPMDLEILFEDEDLMVINKAPGVSIHPSQGHFSDSLANGVAGYFAQKGEPFTCRIVNRLDRDTSGLLIFAKNSLSSCILSEMIRNREIHRTYLAGCCGNLADLATCAPEGVTVSPLPSTSQIGPDSVKPDFSESCEYCAPSESHNFCGDFANTMVSGTIDAPIARVCDSVIEREVNVDRGESAITHFEQLAYLPELDLSVVKLTLETGRTHQIRVHMKYAGHPLPGDFLYNPDFRLIGRQCLHSWKLSFDHPITKKPLSFTTAVPADMQFMAQCNL